MGSYSVSYEYAEQVVDGKKEIIKNKFEYVDGDGNVTSRKLSPNEIKHLTYDEE